MKALKMILSMAAVALAVGAIACAITAYWDNLTEFVNAMKEKWIQKKKSCEAADEEDAFADFADVQ